MINAQELKSKITVDDVIKIIEILGGTIHYEDGSSIITNTICHGGEKPKLYYYKDSSMFHCYTECGDTFDIIELVCRNKEYSFMEAVNWISIQLGYDINSCGFNQNTSKINDWDFINKLSKKRKKEEIYVPVYDSNILNIFQNFYTQDWINEGISTTSMEKYKISYSTLQQKIIIPHFNIDNGLIGVRARSTLDDDFELYGKYAPFKINNISYSHPLSKNLYGLNINQNTIRRKKKIMLVESEKGVLQCDTMFGDDNFTVALCGTNLSDYHRDIMIDMDVQEVIIALDKEYEVDGDSNAIKWSNYIKEKIIDKLSPYFIVTVLWDTQNLLPYKASPTDINKTTLLKLMDNKIYVST